MDSETYINNCLRTASCDEDAILSRLSGPKIQLLHAAMGISTEVGELIYPSDTINVTEELGDLCWYVSIGVAALRDSGVQVSWDDFIHADIDEILSDTAYMASQTYEAHIRSLVVYSSEFLDMAKKYMFYGRELNTTDTIDVLRRIVHGVITCIMCMNIHRTVHVTIEDVWETNIEKLRKRYGDKFTEGAANHRDLEAERAVLEAGGEPDIYKRYEMIVAEEMDEAIAKRGIEYLKAKSPVLLVHTDDTGEFVWAIVVKGSSNYGSDFDTGFWLEAFPTKRDAEEFCKIYDLPVEAV